MAPAELLSPVGVNAWDAGCASLLMVRVPFGVVLSGVRKHDVPAARVDPQVLPTEVIVPPGWILLM
jgi:hypothetical protein